MQVKWREQRGWNVIIDNRPGATGLIGTEAASRAAPDGYTLLMGHIAPNAINPGDFIEPPVPMQWKLDAVAMVAVAPSLLLVQPALGVRSVKELRALLKGLRPLYASDGIGSLAHLQMEWFLRQPKEHVPYKGGGPALQGFLAGDAPIMFSPAPVALPWVKQGRAFAIAQTASVRIAALPDVPTMMEAGERGFDAPLWWAIFAPAGTPPAVIGTWNAATNAILERAEVRQWFAEQGYATKAMSVQEFSEYVESEKRKWREVTRAAR
jgi:tripartite-type tricarboxylate transporter receptor subunit TctC